MTPFGELVRKLRTSRGLTLKDHAAIVGVTPAYLSALEHGHRGFPTREMADRIMDALSAEPGERQAMETVLRYSRPKVSVDTAGLSPLATEAVNRLAGNIARMNEDDLRALLNVVRYDGRTGMASASAAGS